MATIAAGSNRTSNSLTDDERKQLASCAGTLRELAKIYPLITRLERRSVPGAGRLGDTLGREDSSEIVLDRARNAIVGILHADGDEAKWWEWRLAR